MLPVRNETPTSLYNPDLRDFEFKMSNEDNIQQVYILPSQEITTLPYYIAEKGAGELATKLVWQRGIQHNYEMDRKEILKEIMI